MRPGHRTREERDRPRPREDEPPRRMGEQTKSLPPILLARREAKLRVELVGHRVEQVFLGGHMTVERHRRHAEPLGNTADADSFDAELLTQLETRVDDLPARKSSCHGLSIRCRLTSLRCIQRFPTSEMPGTSA